MLCARRLPLPFAAQCSLLSDPSAVCRSRLLLRVHDRLVRFSSRPGVGFPPRVRAKCFPDCYLPVVDCFRFRNGPGVVLTGGQRRRARDRRLHVRLLRVLQLRARQRTHPRESP